MSLLKDIWKFARLIPSSYEVTGIEKIVMGIKRGISDFLVGLYHDIDSECISGTDMVKMETVKKILIKYGADKERLK